MTVASQQFHGSDLKKIAQHYHLNQENIIDYSSNVNPLGLPESIQTQLATHIELIGQYPDRDYTTLREAIAAYTGAEFSSILVGNGSTELISLAIKALQPTNGLIIGPTYSEYEREIKINHGRSKYFPLLEENNFMIDLDALKKALTKDVDLLIICNPNNPTSSSIPKKTLRKILDYCLRWDVYVLIDETYVEFVADVEAISAVSLSHFYKNLFIIRGVSKFFAAPGLRLGYGISGNPSLIRQINQLKNPWTINSLAAYAGELMLQDTAYIQATRTLIHQEQKRIMAHLESWQDIKVYPATANFILIKLNEPYLSHLIFEALIKENLMVRDASSFPFLSNKYIRFCFRTKKDNDRLITVLRSVLDTMAKS